MKLLLFGATGMLGQGALRECLLDADVEKVLAIGRTASGQTHAKLEELVLTDPSDLSGVTLDLSSYDACLFCLGISSVGMSEADYRKITKELTLAVATQLLDRNPSISFLYISGASTDSSEKGSAMWARVKGETENALLAMPFKRVVMSGPASSSRSMAFARRRSSIASSTRSSRRSIRCSKGCLGS